MLKNFMRDEQGQDLIEYTLLLAFVALAAAALFMSAQTSISQIWANASTKLANAATASS
jgi:Flp pilus assembly pilin Flp